MIHFYFYYCTKEKIYEHGCFAPPVEKDTLYSLIYLSYLIMGHGRNERGKGRDGGGGVLYHKG
jgi:hypothetical protein